MLQEPELTPGAAQSQPLPALYAAPCRLKNAQDETPDLGDDEAAPHSAMLELKCVFKAERSSMSCSRRAAAEIRKIKSIRGDILKLMSRDKTGVPGPE